MSKNIILFQILIGTILFSCSNKEHPSSSTSEKAKQHKISLAKNSQKNKYEYLTSDNFIVDFNLISNNKKGNNTYYQTIVTEFRCQVKNASSLGKDTLGLDIRIKYFNTKTRVNRILEPSTVPSYNNDCFCIPIENNSMQYEALNAELNLKGGAYYSSHIYLDENTDYLYIFINNGQDGNDEFRGALKLKSKVF